MNRLSGINVGASGSAARILEEVAKKVSRVLFFSLIFSTLRANVHPNGCRYY